MSEPEKTLTYQATYRTLRADIARGGRGNRTRRSVYLYVDGVFIDSRFGGRRSLKDCLTLAWQWMTETPDDVLETLLEDARDVAHEEVKRLEEELWEATQNLARVASIAQRRLEPHTPGSTDHTTPEGSDE